MAYQKLHTDKQLWKICMNIYVEMYAKATPKADFKKLIESGETRKQNFFKKYYLDEQKMEDIVNKHIKRNHLCKREESRVRFNVYLGSSPTSVKGE